MGGEGLNQHDRADPAVSVAAGLQQRLTVGSDPRGNRCRRTPYLDDEMRVLGELKAEGVIKSAYRRSAGPGGYFLLEGPSIDAVRERVDTLPFVIENLMTLEYDEIYEI